MLQTCVGPSAGGIQTFAGHAVRMGGEECLQNSDGDTPLGTQLCGREKEVCVWGGGDFNAGPSNGSLKVGHHRFHPTFLCSSSFIISL